MEIRTGRKSIYVPASQESGMYRLLSMRGDSEISRTLDTAVGRYLNMIGRSMPDLSTAEWCMVLDSHMGIGVSDWMDVMLVGETALEGMDMERLDQKWGVDDQRMREVMTSLTYAEKQAICEVIEAFRADENGGSYTEIISRVLQQFRPDSPEPEPRERPRTRMSPDRLGA